MTYIDLMKHRYSVSQGFSLTELLVVMAITTVLFSMLMSSMQVTRERAKAVQCASNIRQLGCALVVYATDQGRLPSFANTKGVAGTNFYWEVLMNRGYLPPEPLTSWPAAAGMLYKNGPPVTGVWRCPTVKNQDIANGGGYGGNGGIEQNVAADNEHKAWGCIMNYADLSCQGPPDPVASGGIRMG